MDEQHRILLLRAESVLGAAATLGDAFQKVRAIIGPLNFPEGEKLAAQAIAKMRDKGEVPTPAERAALEIAIKALRPSVLSQRGLLDELPNAEKQTPEMLARWAKFRTAMQPFLYSIGRIDQVAKPQDVPVATGFVIAPRLVVTNKHVVAALSAETMTLEKGQVVVRFGQEFGVVPDAAPQPVLGVVAVHPSLDIAVLEIDPAQTQRALPLGKVNPEPGRYVAAIGYPQADPRNPVFTRAIFNGRYGVKRAAVGQVLGAAEASLYHDCSTLGGNSGSPVVDVETAEVVGLHYEGRLFLYRNEAVDAPSLSGFLAGIA